MKKKISEGFEHVLYERTQLSPEEMILRTEKFYQEMDQRRTVREREFDTRQIPLEVLEKIILTASTAPSGAKATLDILPYFRPIY